MLKSVQLQELLKVRHCVFCIGPAGSGKSAAIDVLKARAKCEEAVALRQRPTIEVLIGDPTPGMTKPLEVVGLLQ